MELSHFDEKGRATMVNVEEKAVTVRTAIASGKVTLLPSTIELIKEGKTKKGDVLGTAQIAGIMGAKKTSELIPMCHNIVLDGVKIEFEFIGESVIMIKSEVTATQKTGVEMEALTAVSVAALTIYDMVKAVDKGVEISDIRLEYKIGGKSGEYSRPKA